MGATWGSCGGHVGVTWARRTSECGCAICSALFWRRRRDAVQRRRSTPKLMMRYLRSGAAAEDEMPWLGRWDWRVRLDAEAYG
eukprot:1891865-Prymnesium_polylepis.1